MEPPATGYETIDHGESHVHRWRVSQLTRLGIPGPLAEVYADHLDWHQVARLVQHGCPPGLALRIVGRYGPLANTNSCLEDVVRWITDEAKPVLQAGSACSAADRP